MKIAVAAEGKDLDAFVSQRAGRAPYYLIFEDKKLLEVIENPFVASFGAGRNVATLLARKGVQVVVAGSFGPNMASILEQAGIRMVTAPGKKVREVVEGI